MSTQKGVLVITNLCRVSWDGAAMLRLVDHAGHTARSLAQCRCKREMLLMVMDCRLVDPEKGPQIPIR